MDKITAVKIKYNDGTYSNEIPIGVLASNVDWDNTNSLADILGTVAFDTKGSIQDQIDDLASGSGGSQANWMELDTTAAAYILNKPAIKAGTGTGSIIEGNGSGATKNYAHAEGNLTTASGNASHAEGNSTTASGHISHAEGSSTTARGDASHAEGSSTTARGHTSHAEGFNTYAGADSAHAEGYGTQALGPWSHAEGRATSPGGRSSHAQGYGCTIAGLVDEDEDESAIWYGECAHAEGYCCECKGDYSHAEGYMTVAERPFTHVEGRLNQLLDGDNYSKVPRYAHIIGGGYYPNEYPDESWSDIDTGYEQGAVRRDIHRVDWDGNAWYAGSLTLGNTTLTEANLQALLNLLT